MTQQIVATNQHGRSRFRLRAEGQTVCLTQLETFEAINATKQCISLHRENLFAQVELSPAATVKESLTIRSVGARRVRRMVTFYSKIKHRKDTPI